MDLSIVDDAFDPEYLFTVDLRMKSRGVCKSTYNYFYNNALWVNAYAQIQIPQKLYLRINGWYLLKTMAVRRTQ